MDRITSAEQHRRRQPKPQEELRGPPARAFRAPREGTDLLASLRFLARDWRARAGAEQGAMLMGRMDRMGRSGSGSD